MESQHGLIFMVRRGKLDYLAPARLDDLILVATEVVAIRGASVSLRQTVWRDGKLLVEIGLDLACLRAADQRPHRIPPRWRDALMSMISP